MSTPSPTPPELNDGQWYDTQEEAFRAMEERKDTIVVKWGNFKFTSFTDQETFLDFMLEECEAEARQFYELLLADKPQRMFADLDGEGLTITKAEVLALFEKLMIEAFEAVHMPYKKKYVRILCSTGEKISFHWSYLGGLTFKNSEEQKEFWKYVEFLIESDPSGEFANLCFLRTRADNKMELKNVLDLGVYSKNRAMRTMGSCKAGSDRVLKPCRLKEGKIRNIDNYEPLDYLIYEGDSESHYQFKVPEYQKVKNRFLSREQIEKLILKYVPNVSVKELKNRMFTLKNEGTRTCIMGGEENTSDNCFVIWRRDGLYYGCHDSGCEGRTHKICELGEVVTPGSGTNWFKLRKKAGEADTKEKYNEVCREVVDYMNSMYTAVLEGTRVMIVHTRADEDCDIHSITKRVVPETMMMTSASLSDILASKILTTKYPNPNKKDALQTCNPYKLWWFSAVRKERTKMVFEPFPPGGSVIRSAQKSFNLWDGYAITHDDCTGSGATRETSPTLEHFHKRWCKGNDTDYKWLMGWFATLIQHPDKKLHSAIVLKAKEGAVKGLPLTVIETIMGSKYFFQPSSPDEILDGFNSSMAAKKLLFMDELFWGGDRGKSGTLKKLITETHWTIKTKHLPDYVIKNLFGVFIASNEGWVVPAGTNARRWFVLEVDNELAGIEHKHLDIIQSIYKELEDPVKVLALAKTFYEWDLSDFNDRRPPQTAGLRTQKMMSFRPCEKFAHQALNDGVIPGLEDEEFKFGEFAVKSSILKAYQKTMNDKHLASKIFWDNMEEMLGGDFKKTKTKKLSGEVKRGFVLPTLEEARNTFRSFIGDSQWTFDDISSEAEDEDEDEDEDETEVEAEKQGLIPTQASGDLFSDSDSE
jgi:hypothetical protein